MRAFCSVTHRWAGLAIAAFLVVTGLTGAVIPWERKLDALLNPHLLRGQAAGPALPPLDLARQIEARYRQIRVTDVPLTPEPGRSLAFTVEPRVDPATGRLFEPGFNQVFVDPVTGAELGKRAWGAAWPVTRENLMSFLYVLHYSMHVPQLWGIDTWGVWLLGGVAVIWTLDCFAGLYLTFPARRRDTLEGVSSAAASRQQSGARRSWRQRWWPAWKVRWRGGAVKLNFDLHRAFGLWTWFVLFILAFTAFSMNLYEEVFYPLMSRVSQVTPSPFDVRTPADWRQPVEPALGFAAILERARQAARERGWRAPAGSVYYTAAYGIYAVSFFAPGGEHGAAGAGPPVLYFDATDGRSLGERQPWQGSVADLFMQAQFPLHSGRILGLPGRILVSAMGLIVAMVSITGVIVWHRKRQARLALKRQLGATLDELPVEP